MTATPITWRPAPARARIALTVAALWARARASMRARARRSGPLVRRATSTLCELGAAGCAVWAFWQLAPWAGGLALAAALYVAGVLVAPAAAEVDDQ